MLVLKLCLFLLFFFPRYTLKRRISLLSNVFFSQRLRNTVDESSKNIKMRLLRNDSEKSVARNSKCSPDIDINVIQI